MRSAARVALPLLLAASALVAAGCGSGRHTPPAELALQREDLVVVSRALQTLLAQTEAEVAASRAAWPSIYAGLPPRRFGLSTPRLRAAVEAAGRLQLPTLLDERQAAVLRGPSASLVGLYRAFVVLAGRGWELVGEAAYQIEHGSLRAARFARDNVALYIDSIYDGHFSVAQIGKQLTRAYAKLGGAPAFGATLTPAEVAQLAARYSEPVAQLQPHVAVRLGS